MAIHNVRSIIMCIVFLCGGGGGLFSYYNGTCTNSHLIWQVLYYMPVSIGLVPNSIH